MTQNAQLKAAFGGDDMVEVAVGPSCLAPDSIADAGQVRQGGLHKILPWFFERLFGG
jgi:hypothetical protein